MKYNFVEIGCCCYYDTCVDEYGLDSVGLLVEPVKEYYDVLPSSDSVKKECVAIGDIDGEITFTAAIAKDVKYIPHDVVIRLTKDPVEYHKLTEIHGPILIGGWSSIYKDTIHPDVLKYCKDITVQCLTFETLMNKYNISEIDHLKIDVEGNEYVILQSILNLLQQEKIKISSIRFEYNDRSNKNELDKLIDIFKSTYGYLDEYIIQGFNEDCFLTYAP